MSLEFAEQVALVTGGSSGIGRAAALALAAKGAKVMVAGRDRERLKRVVQDIETAGGVAVWQVADVTQESQVAELMEVTAARLGGLHSVIANAGTLGAMGDVTAMAAEDWHATLLTNLTSAFYCAKYALPHLLTTQGNLVFVSSFVGSTCGFAGMSAYAASKAGMVGLARNLAAEYGPAGIRVNAILPGGTDTPMGEMVANSPESKAYVSGLHALQRTAEPAEIAEVVCFMASRSASFVTGCALLADGGLSVFKA